MFYLAVSELGLSRRIDRIAAFALPKPSCSTRQKPAGSLQPFRCSSQVWQTDRQNCRSIYSACTQSFACKIKTQTCSFL